MFPVFISVSCLPKQVAQWCTQVGRTLGMRQNAHQVVGSWAQLAGSGPRPPRTPAIRGAGATGVHGKIGKIGKIGKTLHRPGPRSGLLASSCSWLSSCTARVQGPCRRAPKKHHGSEGRSGPAASSPDCPNGTF